MATKKASKTKRPAASENKDNEKTTSRLYRSETNRILGGVSAGLADFFSIDPTLVRVIFVLLSVFGGSGILIYILLWIIVPAENSGNIGLTNEDLKNNAKEIGKKAQEFGNNIGKSVERQNSRQIIGIILLSLGGLFLLSNLGVFGVINFEKLWPLILVAIGLAILFRNGDK